MERPLYHRNSPLWPRNAGRILIGFGILIAMVELVLGIISLVG